MSTARSYDLTRPEIIARFQERIAQNARTKLKRDEIAHLTLYFVDRLLDLQNARRDDKEGILQLCQQEKELLEQGYPKNSINSYYLPKYTAVIKQAIASGQIELNDRNSYHRSRLNDKGQLVEESRHFAFDGLRYDLETQTALRKIQTAKNNNRQDDLKSVKLSAYLQAIASATLVKTPESLTIAIAALTGRRFAEVVSVGKFELTEHPYQLLFSGQQKKQNPEPYLIFTLIPAQEVWSLIQEYRTLPLIESLSGLDDEHPLMGNLNDRVNRDVHNLLGNTGIVPIPQGYKTISIHRLRGLYGRIIVHYFCPPDQHEHRFIQRYLGHVFASDESDRPNARATEHYFHYNLLADNNQLLLEKGVKLHPMSSSASNSGSQTDKPITSLNSQPTINITLQLPEAIAQQQWQSILNSAFSQGASAVKLLENLELANPNWGISQALGFLSQEVSTLRQQVAALTLENQKLPEPSENIDNEALKAKQEKLKLEYASLKQENQELLREISLLKEKNAKMVQMYQNIVAAFASPSEKPELLPETAVDPSLPGRVEFSSKPEERSQQSSDEREDEFKAKEPAKRSRKASLLPENVERHINAIIDWNKAHPTSAYAITEGLLTKFFNLNRELVLEYLQERDLTEYHASIGVTDANKRGFNRQKDRVALKDDIVEFVKAKVKEA